MNTLRAKSKLTIHHPIGSFDWAEAILADTRRLTPEQVALVLQKNPETPLTRTLRHYLVRLKRRERRSGVKPRNAAAWEFILFDAKALYEIKVAELRLDRGTDANRLEDHEIAAERAYKAMLEEIKICHIDWVVLRNLLSLPIREPRLFVDLESQSRFPGAELAA